MLNRELNMSLEFKGDVCLVCGFLSHQNKSGAQTLDGDIMAVTGRYEITNNVLAVLFTGIPGMLLDSKDASSLFSLFFYSLYVFTILSYSPLLSVQRSSLGICSKELEVSRKSMQHSGRGCPVPACSPSPSIQSLFVLSFTHILTPSSHNIQITEPVTHTVALHFLSLLCLCFH